MSMQTEYDYKLPEEPQEIVTIKVPYNPPTGAMRVPVKTEKYHVLKTIYGFDAWSKAATHTDAKVTISQGDYFVFKKKNGMVYVSKTLDKTYYWINPADNTQDIQR